MRSSCSMTFPNRLWPTVVSLSAPSASSGREAYPGDVFYPSTAVCLSALGPAR